MSDSTLDAIEAQLDDLFQQQAYGDALTLATQVHASGRFPEGAPLFYYYQICAATRLQNTALALQLIDQMLDEGLWLGRSLLQDSPDLKQLQGDPVFETRVNRNYERQHAIPAKTYTLEPRDRLDRTAGEPYPLLLVLHSNGSSAEKAMPFWRHAAERGWLVALPQSSQYVWAGAAVWDDLETTCQDVLRSLNTLGQRYPIDSRQVIFAGHSLGGQMAIRFLLDGPYEGLGFLAVSPYMTELEPFVPLVEACEGRNLRGYMIVGEKDPVILPTVNQALKDLLVSHQIACEMEVVPGAGHDYPPRFAESLERALEFIISS